MDKRINLFGLLKQEKQLTKILVYCAKETVDDPYEKTTTKSFLNPVAIDALVRDISPEALVWKYYGNIPMGSKELICEKRHINTLKSADKIKIGDNYYKTRKDDSKGFSIIERNDYIIVVVELKTINI
jgi:hypothetical protein